MPRLPVVLFAVSIFFCASCSDGGRDRAGGWYKEEQSPTKAAPEKEPGEDEEVAHFKKVLTDPELRKKLHDRVPSLQLIDWVTKDGKSRLDQDVHDDQTVRDEKSAAEEFKLNGGEVRYTGDAVTTVVLAHLKWKEPRKAVDPGLSLLRFLPQVKTISLYNSTVTDSGLRHLQGLSKLTELDLGYTSIGDEGLKHLADLTEMEALGLNSTNVTDAGLKHLRKMTKLRTLDLDAKGITHAALQQLTDMKQLRKLKVYTGMAKADLERIRQAMPDCEILQ